MATIKISGVSGFVVLEVDGLINNIPVADFDYWFQGLDTALRDVPHNKTYTTPTLDLQDGTGTPIGNEAAVDAYITGLTGGATTDVSVQANQNFNQEVKGTGFYNNPIALNITTYDTNGFHDATSKSSGTATAGGASTLTDTGQSWTIDQFATMIVRITGGTGIGQVRLISTNTATVLTVDSAWTVNPDATSIYDISISNRLTIPQGKGGKYLVCSKLTFSGDATSYRGISCWINGVFINSRFASPVATLESAITYGAQVVELNEGDYIEIRAQQQTGADLNMIGGAGEKVWLQLTAQRGVQ